MSDHPRQRYEIGPETQARLDAEWAPMLEHLERDPLRAPHSDAIIEEEAGYVLAERPGGAPLALLRWINVPDAPPRADVIHGRWRYDDERLLALLALLTVFRSTVEAGVVDFAIGDPRMASLLERLGAGPCRRPDVAERSARG